MDFFQIGTREIEKGPRKGTLEVYADFVVGRSKDLMVRGRSFYAIWDEKAGLWSTDEYDVQRLVDEALDEYAVKLRASGTECSVKHLRSFGSNSWQQFRNFLSNISDNSKPLNQNLTFSNTDVKKSDHVSKRLPYPLEAGECPAWNELVGTLYSVEERAKIEWAIGAIVSGDSKKIEKFLVFYGSAGTGKSTILKIIEKLFLGYTTTFDAKALGSNNGSFATEVFKANPLVAIQHDGDLSKIEDNTKLNSIVSHEDMPMNEKYKPTYTDKVNAFLFMGTNQPVKISDAKSGIIRRLIDVNPTGVKIPVNHYHTLMGQIDFELGAIAYHCLQVYRSMGKNYYNGYRPLEMMLQTDVFFNFVEAYYDIFKKQDGCTLRQAYQLYKEFCDETGIERAQPQYKVREELRNYFEEFHDRYELDGHTVRSYYSGFTANQFKAPTKEPNAYSLVLEETTSILDELLKDQPAQGATEAETPKQRWSTVRTRLGQLDTSALHFVKVPENHIVIDFDLKGEDGSKSLERNLEAASVWPATYAELSKSGAGVHLHYDYAGDASELASAYSEGIEVKVYSGDASLRRRLSKCNAVPVSTISSGLPIKEKKPVIADKTIKSEKGLRDLIGRNIRKEIHPGTKPSIDFIKKILDEAYDSGMVYDLSDMKSTLLAFANNSTHQPMECLKMVQNMKFIGQQTEKQIAEAVTPKDDRLVFFDVEVFPNLFVICWKFEGKESSIVRMINPTALEVGELMKMKLVGFNCRRYDNHILYAAYLGYDNAQLYQLSQKLIDNERSGTFGEAYNLSYCDIYDFSSIKQSLKKFGIDLGLHHIEMDIPWDKPVPKELWATVVEYCANDISITEATFENRRGDYVARQILAELSDLSINDSTARHTAKIIFGNDRQATKQFVYTDLSTIFPGYKFDLGKSSYRGENPGEGGYVYAEPGIYTDVVLLDIASMHPTSLEQLNYFGAYTDKFSDLKRARMAIKHGKYNEARQMLDGRLAPYLHDEKGAKDLSYALKIVINIVYGLTSAKFENPFKDPRNIDNIVAKRGALFMIDLKHFVQEQGFQVVHIKTDSIKIANATPEIIKAVEDFGLQYGYDFENEGTYDRFCLVNDAVYIARKAECLSDCWVAVGAQFQHPYVFKTLFSGDEVTFDDLCETKQVMKGTIHIDFEDGKEAQHVGRIGRFVPVTSGGGLLYRIHEGKNFAVSGTKGYRWVEATQFKDDVHEIDTDYYEALADSAVKTVEKFGSFEEFISQMKEN